MEVKLKNYNCETWKYEDTGERVSTMTLARSMDAEQMANLLADWANTGNGARSGSLLGLELTRQHRHLQAVTVQILLYALHEVGRQQYSDGRNEHEVETCNLLSRWLEEERNYWFGRENGGEVP